MGSGPSGIAAASSGLLPAIPLIHTILSNVHDLVAWRKAVGEASGGQPGGGRMHEHPNPAAGPPPSPQPSAASIPLSPPLPRHLTLLMEGLEGAVKLVSDKIEAVSNAIDKHWTSVKQVRGKCELCESGVLSGHICGFELGSMNIAHNMSP